MKCVTWEQTLFLITIESTDLEVDRYEILVEEVDGIKPKHRLIGEDFWIDLFTQVRERFLEWENIDRERTMTISQIDDFRKEVFCRTVIFYGDEELEYCKETIMDYENLL